MSDLEILVAFRKAEATDHITKLTKSVHNCQNGECDGCPALPACRELVNNNAAHNFYYGYNDWAKRTPFLSLSELQQQYPELLI